MRLAGNGTNAAWNEVGFANAAAIGSARLELDGRGFLSIPPPIPLMPISM